MRFFLKIVEIELITGHVENVEIIHKFQDN